MEIIVDENLHLFTIEVLIESGFHPLSIDDILDWGANDEDIYRYATDNEIAIMTHDRRFGQLYFTSQTKSPTTIILQVLSKHPGQTNKLLIKALKELDIINNENYHNKLIIIEQSKIRIRSRQI